MWVQYWVWDSGPVQSGQVPQGWRGWGGGVSLVRRGPHMWEKGWARDERLYGREEHLGNGKGMRWAWDRGRDTYCQIQN